ncbi:MAG: SpoIIE family protein phosphatase [Tissierellia bacterium]|jgi:hypothetical protein|nr:SpoIIE family protein phosphatase [Tissierellia bacterium]
MNSLFPDIAVVSRNRYTEELCGDHVELQKGDNRTILVMADGLGSGVKANILSTMTAKMLSTMLAGGMALEEAIGCMLETLPVCGTRNIAYSTFTIAAMDKDDYLTIIEYDNPPFLFLRDGRPHHVERVTKTVHNRQLIRSRFQVQEDDVVLFYSDGVLYAGTEMQLNQDWTGPDIAEFMQYMYFPDYSARTLVNILMDRVLELYGEKPYDDSTVCGIKFRKRAVLNLMIGPPHDPEEDAGVVKEFLQRDGYHIVCGGTTADIVASHLGRSIVCEPAAAESEIPPVCHLEGVDLVTEGVITVSYVLRNIRETFAGQDIEERLRKNDAAARLSRYLLDATDIFIFAGSAVNPAHQGQGSQFSFSYKMRQLEELAELLRRLGKDVVLHYC